MPAPTRRPARFDGGATNRSADAALARRLDSEWHDVRLRHDGKACGWASEVPALEGCTTLDDVVAACRPATTTSDPATLALLHRTQTGCPIAGQCLLRALQPLLRELSRRDPRADLGDYLGASWPVLMAHNPERTTRVLLGLALDTRRSVVRERGGLWLVDGSVEPASTPPDDDVAAAAVITLARQLRLVPEPSADVLQSVYVDGLSSREAAERHHTSSDMVRYRCSTAVRTLRRHRQRLVDDLTA